MIRFIFSYILLILLCQCSDSATSPSPFDRIDAMCDNNPQRALAMLDKIDGSNLPDEDRHRCDLLRIKANDKAFIRHSSDSLILDVINYYSNHDDTRLYPEALYYAGRVYSDIGDYPAALSYFKKSLHLLKKHDLPDLKARALSQSSNLLIAMRQYPGAIEYAREALRIDSAAGDPVCVMFDLERLGQAYLHNRNYDESEDCFLKARAIASEFSLPDSIDHLTYIAAIKYHQNRLDSAMTLIRKVLPHGDSASRATALEYAAEIFRCADMPDSATIYARQLIESEDFHNQKVGYMSLLSDQLLNIVPEDSLTQYSRHLSNAASDCINESLDMEMSLRNNSFGQSSLATETTGSHLPWLAAAIAAALMLLGTLLFFFIRRHAGRHSEASGGQEAPPSASGFADSHYATVSDADAADNDTRASLQTKLSGDAIEYAEANGYRCAISQEILQSEIYHTLKSKASHEIAIETDINAWDQLNDYIELQFPQFATSLNILTRGQCTPDELRLAQLTAIGLSPSQIATLSNRSRSAISCRKDALMKKMFDGQLQNQYFEVIIALIKATRPARSSLPPVPRRSPSGAPNATAAAAPRTSPPRPG